VNIPDAVLAPVKNGTYRAIFDATRAAEKPTDLLPALNMAGFGTERVGSYQRSVSEREVCYRIPRPRGRRHFG
jgi:hypothetical protein